MDNFLNPFKIVIEKYQSTLNHIAEVSKPGQPRGTQDPHNWKSLLLGVRGFESHPLHYIIQTKMNKIKKY